MQSQNTLNKLSRRNWLRDTAIAVTGVALSPSLLTSCADHVIPEPGGGLGGTPITEGELRSASQNLKNMAAWWQELYLTTGNYEKNIHTLFKSGQKPSSWKDFLINSFITVALGVFDVAGLEIPFLGPAFAITVNFINKWASGYDRPASFDTTFGDFENKHEIIYIAVRDKLLLLADEKDNYKSLRDAWQQEIEFNNKKYTLKELADIHFPTVSNGGDYVKLQTAAYEKFRKDLWNMMIIKTGQLNYTIRHEDTYYNDSYHPTHYAERIYQEHKAYYVRGYYSPAGLNGGFYYRYWYFTFDGYELSDEAAYILFKDGRPEQTLNDEGLFTRDYVFKQFNKEKPDFFGYHDIRKDYEKGPGPGDAYYFDINGDNWDFTGGAFPDLVKLK
ncbi:hypothetical protein [Spirosoma validum]|uniref:Uncharacterized protein n=1 Tax=Spirosoma validum TaxID=2771355 RepID=A0A927AZC3_9BACT|nr:hypothetical protein [Spirosoma validum]MBD2752521.1 hypothetical protein [Spirosoma validum]